MIAVAVWLILTYAFTFTQVRGQGMFPALKDGDLCVIFRTGLQQTLGDGFRKDDVVLYEVGGKRYIGRVAAIEGDKVTIGKNGGLSVNGVSQSSEILFQTYARGDEEYSAIVPNGCLFLLGDHRTDTKDSRDFGPIPLDSVEGKVITIMRRRGL